MESATPEEKVTEVARKLKEGSSFIIQALRFQKGRMKLFRRFAIHKNRSDVAKQIMIDCIEFCGPISPPDNDTGPPTTLLIKLSVTELPGLIAPYIPGSVKSHAKCRNIGNHRDLVRT